MTKNSQLAITHFHRRRYPRIDLSLPVEYTIRELCDHNLTNTGTIGGGGLMLFLPTAVAVGSVMELKLLLPDRVTISCTARVVWTELVTGLEPNDFKAGVAFEQIQEYDLEFLRNFIREQQNPNNVLPSERYKDYTRGSSK